MKFVITILSLMSLLSLYGCSKSPQSDRSSATKTISYRGGIVQFSLPEHWREEYEPEGGGTFYEDRQDSGTLRLNVITAESKSGESLEQAIERSFPTETCEALSGGLRMRHRIVDSEERGTPIRLHLWEIPVPVPPNRLRVVCFTHTIAASQESDPATIAELKLVEQAIRSAEYSRKPGVVSSDTR